MAIEVGTHSGTFHADDVLSFALIRTFVDDQATVVRTRDRDRLATCDVVFDVGGELDAERQRFDHHQASYVGPRSSAGLILDWLEQTGRVPPGLARHLRERAVDYIDAVDTGRTPPAVDIPCFARIVEVMGQGLDTADELQAAFLRAAEIGCTLIAGLRRGFEEAERARTAVITAMDEAVREGSRVILLDRYHPWKPIYFDHGGGSHPTDFVLFPSEETWKVVAIPPSIGAFEQKRSLPESWAGKMADELEQATGEPGSVFCHKNRFIAVFQTRDAALRALDRFGLIQGAAPTDEPRPATP